MWESSLARDVMVTRLITLPPDDHILDGLDVLLTRGISGAPVVDGDRYLGSFSEQSCWQTLVEMNQALSESAARDFRLVLARDIMKTNLVVFSPGTHTLIATDELIGHRVAGGPVVDNDARWIGSFSEHTAMKALLDMAMHQTPAGMVSSYMDPDPRRVVSPDTFLVDMIVRFHETKYRRFPVVDDSRLIGQISRQDVLRAALPWLVRFVESPHGPAAQPTSLRVKDVCSHTAATVEEDFDLLRIVRLFHDTSARRLPVLRGESVVGQVSRRDVLRKVIHFFPVDSTHGMPRPLYLSFSGESSPGVIEGRQPAG